MGKTLQKGDLIPDVSLKDQEGNLIDLPSLVGEKALVVYFYPKDDTPGCTAEACGFRDRYEEFADMGADIVGISSDTVGSHKKFADKYGLNFTLLSDCNGQAEKEFGVPRNLLGLLPGRVTYVFDRAGKLVYSFSSAMKATRHIEEAMEALKV
ncbi:peroxiredoxin [Marinoscillum sp.]|uniref:peroxiredoxin n=1 Tax=Marinoscillum sp. TaxID=2024838 RepID=UPI003BACB61C